NVPSAIQSTRTEGSFSNILKLYTTPSLNRTSPFSSCSPVFFCANEGRAVINKTRAVRVFLVIILSEFMSDAKVISLPQTQKRNFPTKKKESSRPPSVSPKLTLKH